jgi:hypothetical protein
MDVKIKSMELLSHRGYWKKPEEKNTKSANDLSFKHAWGIETDIRDFDKELVISHDVAKDNNYSAAYLLEQYNHYPEKCTLALNVKADGLSVILLDLLKQYKIDNYFVFDMSIPETLRYLQLEMNVYIRYSEYEVPNAALYAKAKGIWLDIFKEIWFDKSFVDLQLNNGKKIAFVSPELHGRDEMELWALIKENNWHLSSQVLLCTDVPDKAKIYFDL